MNLLCSFSWLWWSIIGFFAGSFPFSVWLGNLIIRTDIRQFGDHNPGSMNAWKGGGPKLGIPALILDYLKGAIPVYMAAYIFSISDWPLVPVSLAPVCGHAFSPFLKFRGGRGIAVTFGIWSGLTLWEGPTILGAFLAIFLLFQADDRWTFILGMLGLLGYLLWQETASYVYVIWSVNLLVFCIMSRRDLGTLPRPRRWVFKILRRRN